VSFQITVLKVLAGQPEGRTSVADLTRYVKVLMTSGPDWIERTNRLAARAPQLDILGEGFVRRDENGWQITQAGRNFLAWLERRVSEVSFDQQSSEAIPALFKTERKSQRLRLVVDNTRPPTGRDPDRTRRSA
jgi:hypothetical protein